jgi:CBS domain-containing protein
MYILMSLTIRDILRKKLESIEEMTSVQEAAKKMKDKNVSSLVVVDVNGKPEGLVTEGDLVRKVCLMMYVLVTTKEIMSFPIITIKASSSPSAAANYMMIAAFGLILIFTSNQANLLLNTPYPPFGVITISIMGLSSYLVLVGIYSSAISAAEDSKLRQSIRTFALKETSLLDSIGMAQMEQEIEKRVLVLTKQNQDRMAEESGIQPSLTEEDMKEYLQQVIEEVKKDRRKP